MMVAGYATSASLHDRRSTRERSRAGLDARTFSRQVATRLSRVATIESIGSSIRIEGAKLRDRDVERLLSNLRLGSFTSRDEREVAGYAEVMETILSSFDAIPLNENDIRQLHLLAHSSQASPPRSMQP